MRDAATTIVQATPLVTSTSECVADGIVATIVTILAEDREVVVIALLKLLEVPTTHPLAATEAIASATVLTDSREVSAVAVMEILATAKEDNPVETSIAVATTAVETSAVETSTAVATTAVVTSAEAILAEAMAHLEATVLAEVVKSVKVVTQAVAAPQPVVATLAEATRAATTVVPSAEALSEATVATAVVVPSVEHAATEAVAVPLAEAIAEAVEAVVEVATATAVSEAHADKHIHIKKQMPFPDLGNGISMSQKRHFQGLEMPFVFPPSHAYRFHMQFY